MSFLDAAERRLGPALELRPGSVLLFALAAISVVVFYDFLTFRELYLFKDIGSDTINGRYPRLVMIADYLREHGLPKWSFFQGMGQNILPFALGNPFDLILYLIGPDHLAYGIAYVELLKILLAGMFFFLYLRVVGMSPFACLVGGLLYAMSGFMIVGGGWYKFSTEGVYFALLLYAFERVLVYRSWWLFPLAVALIGADVPFNVYLFGVFILIYSVFRYVDAGGGSPRDYLVFIGKLAALGALGVGISAFFFVSAVLEMVESPRVAGEATFMDRLSQVPVLALAGEKHYVTALMRFFSSDMMGTGSRFAGWQNYLEAPMFYCGLLTLLIVPQVFTGGGAGKRLLYAALLIAVAVPVLLPFFRFAIWLFSGDYYRTYSVFVAVVLLFGALRALSATDREGRLGTPLLLGTGLALAAVLLFPYFLGAGRVMDPVLVKVTLVLLAVYCVLVYALAGSPHKTMAKVALLAVLCVELGYFTSVNVNERPVISAEEFRGKVGYNDHTVEALAHIGDIDGGFYRVEKGYSSGPAQHRSMNDSKVQGYRGTRSYHSFNQLNYIKFLDAVEIIDANVEPQTRWAPGLGGRPLLLTLASVKYFLARDGVGRFLGRTYEKLGEFGDVSVLRNRYHLPFGFAYGRYMTRSAFERLKPLQKDIALLNAVVVPDDAAGRFEQYERLEAGAVDRRYSLPAYRADINALRQDTLSISSHGPNRIAGTIELESHKMLFFSIPYDRGWSAYVDGVRIEPMRVNIGFMGIPLTPGQHHVRLEFQPRYLWSSAALSAAALLLYAGLLWFSGRRRPARALAPELPGRAGDDF